MVADSRGVPDFGLLHADLAAGRKDRLLYYAFDLLYLDGFDLRGARLAERKHVHAELLAGVFERILYAEHLEGDGPEIHERACAMGLEGIISKQQDAATSCGKPCLKACARTSNRQPCPPRYAGHRAQRAADEAGVPPVQVALDGRTGSARRPARRSPKEHG